MALATDPTGFNFGPMAWLGLAEGLLNPAQNNGQRLGAGLAGATQGVMQQFQMSQMQDKLMKAKEAEAALKRLSDPTGANYAPTSTPTAPPSPDFQGPMAPTVTPAKYSTMGDMLSVAPEAVISARLKALSNPLGDLPDAAKNAVFMAQHPELAHLFPGQEQKDSTAEKNIVALYGPDWKNKPEAVKQFNQMTLPMQVTMPNLFPDPVKQGQITVQSKLLESYNNEATQLQDIEFFNDRFKQALSAWPKTGAGGNLKLTLAQLGNSVGIETKGQDEAQLMQSIQDYLTPRMRVTGSGSTSDMEMKTFMNAIPNLLRTPGGNARVAQMLDRFAERKRAASEIANDLFAKGNLTPTGVYDGLKARGLDKVLTPEQSLQFRSGNLSSRPLTKEGFAQMNANDLTMIDAAKLTPEQHRWLDEALKRNGY